MLIGTVEILSLQSSVALRGNGSGLGALGAGIQLRKSGCVECDDDDDGCAYDDADDAPGSLAVSEEHRLVISETASAFEGCSRSTSRRSESAA